MRTLTKRISAAALAGLAVLAVTVPQARAQYMRQGTLPVYSSGVNPRSPFYNPVMPLYRAGPGLSMQQAMYNSFAPLYAASRLPPWMYGYNPYPSPIIASGPSMPPYYPSTPYANPYAYGGYGAVNPYLTGYGGAGYAAGANPYGQLAASGNPYTSALAASAPSGSGSGYNPYMSYPTDPYSGFLYGSADMVRAQGTLMMDQERARLMRELAVQAKQQTRRLKFDTDKYIRDNTPTLTEEMAKNLTRLVKRIQDNASPGEVDSGKAANVLVADLAKHADKKSSAGSVPIDEEVLKHINITGPRGGNLGLLRNGGQIAWPASLDGLLSDPERGQIDNLAKGLFELGLEKKLNHNLLHDLEVRVQRLQELLGAKVNEIPSGQFVDARHFLNDLQSAVRALGQGMAPVYAEWRQFVRNGKTAQDVAEWLNSRGLLVAPAIPGDEAAYRALHTALANYDVAVHAQVASNR